MDTNYICNVIRDGQTIYTGLDVQIERNSIIDLSTNSAAPTFHYDAFIRVILDESLLYQNDFLVTTDAPKQKIWQILDEPQGWPDNHMEMELARRTRYQ